MPEPKVKTPENVSSTTEMLAFHEEVKLRRSILDRVKRINDDDFSEKELEKLWLSTHYYIKQTRNKMDFYDKGTVAYTEPEYSEEEWTNQISTVRNRMNDLESKNTFIKTDYTTDTFKNAIKYVIPRSLAEQRFGLLHLNYVFQTMFDLLGLRVIVNNQSLGHTHLANKTILECLTDEGYVLPNTRYQQYHSTWDTCSISSTAYTQILKVLIGFWSVRPGVAMQGISSEDWLEDARNVCSYLKQVFDQKTATTNLISGDWADDFNNNRGNSPQSFDRLWCNNNFTMPKNHPDYSAPSHIMHTAPRHLFDSIMF